MENGRLWDVSRQEYDRDEEHLRSTSFKDFLKGPWFYHDRHIAKTHPFKSSPSMLLGSLVHDYLLEGKKCWTTDKKSSAAAFASGLVPIGKDTGSVNETQVLQMCDAIARNTFAMSLLSAGGFQEQGIVCDHVTEFGVVKCKARLDRIQHDGSIPDLKTTRRHEERDFFRDVVDFGYDISIVWYEMVRNSLPSFEDCTAPAFWVCVTSSEPYRCVVREVPQEVREVCIPKIEGGLIRFAKCESEDDWPDSEQDGPQRVDVPMWYLKS